jgi:hypothetical protein
MRWNTMRVKKNAAKAEAEWKQKMEKQQEEPSFLARITTLGGSARDGKESRRVNRAAEA